MPSFMDKYLKGACNDEFFDRLVYSSHRIELKGESFRKRKTKKDEEKND